MFRMNSYNEGTFYTMVPLSRQAVVPGQSVSIDLQANWETPAFTRNVLTGGIASVFAFYVPYRLIWDEWVDFISDPEWTGTFPTSTVLFKSMFEGDVGQNTFGRRAYKLIYNQYFGSDQFGEAARYGLYDVADDAFGGIKFVRTADQFLGGLMPQDAAPDDAYEAPVTGTAPGQIATIGLNEFRQRMKEARSDRRSNLTGDKYVDAMRRMGVQLDWKIQNAPEFLGSVSTDFDAKETRATYTAAEPAPAGAAAVGRAYSRYGAQQSLKTSRKFFAEHGIVVTLLVVRPFTWARTFKATQDVFPKDRENFFLGDNQTGVNAAGPGAFGVTGPAYYQSRFSYLRKGLNAVGNQSAAPWYVDNDAADLAELIWPLVAVPQDNNLESDLAVYTRYKAMGPTPVKSVSF